MELIQTGKIVNTHGINGELKIESWADSPEKITQLKTVWIDGKSYKITSSRIHKSNVLVRFESVKSIDDAEQLKGKIVYADRSDFHLGDHTFFIRDLEGLTVQDADSGEEYGVLEEVLIYPGNDVYRIVSADKKEFLIPAIRDCIIETDISAGIMKIRPLPGLFD